MSDSKLPQPGADTSRAPRHPGNPPWDFVIVGSGFGGSVSALRLAEKGYRVLVLEQGRRWHPEDFAKSNWDLSRWMWRPSVGLRGIFSMVFMKHVTVLHGVGVGGGSLVYGNTLPVPPQEFFRSGSWATLADFQTELAPHYQTAKRMLGATTNPRLLTGDEVLRKLGKELGRPDSAFSATEVGVFFGPPGERAADPYFDGAGPERVGCTFCGGCMTGCRVGAKNTLDRNYLYLAERAGAVVQPDSTVTAVRPLDGATGETGYRVELRSHGRRSALETRQLIFAGGVMGTVPLLLALREDGQGLPRLSARVGDFVRTNSESLLGVTTTDPTTDLSEGVAITSILHTDAHSHIEPVRYARGSGFFRLLGLPHAPGASVAARVFGAVLSLLVDPLGWFWALSVWDFGRRTQILLYMRTLEGSLQFRLGRSVFTAYQRGLVAQLEPGAPAPQAFMAEATDLARRFAAAVRGKVIAMWSETLLASPTTAHVLGGACMGATAEDGVIDAQHRVHGYSGLYVIDGSAVSANPGVNPSLTITALAERAMSFIPSKAGATAAGSRRGRTVGTTPAAPTA